VRSARRFLLVLGAAAAAVAVLQGLAGLTDLTLYAAPLLLIVSLLLGGRFVGEDRILARWGVARPGRRVRAQRRWSHARDRALASLLDCAACTLRGPPAAAAA
jgi:membrane protein implicated in regulation of membrane protease activity